MMPVSALNFGRRLVIAGVVGRDLVARGLERHRDRRTDAAGSARDQCYPCHAASSPLGLTLPAAPSGRSDFAMAPRQADVALDAHGDAHAAADAQRGQALLGVALLHLVQQRGQHARARGADRVADGDGAAVDVHLGGVPAHVLVDRAAPARRRPRWPRSGRGRRPSSRPSPAPCGEAGIGPVPMIAGSTPACAQDTMRASGFSPRLSASSAAHQHQRRGAVVDARGVAGRHRAVLAEGRPQLGHRFERGAERGCIRPCRRRRRPCGS